MKAEKDGVDLSNQIKHIRLYIICTGAFAFFSLALMLVFKYKDKPKKDEKTDDPKVRADKIGDHNVAVGSATNLSPENTEGQLGSDGNLGAD